MPIRSGPSPFQSNTAAPPAGATSLDLEQDFNGLTISPSPAVAAAAAEKFSDSQDAQKSSASQKLSSTRQTTSSSRTRTQEVQRCTTHSSSRQNSRNTAHGRSERSSSRKEGHQSSPRVEDIPPPPLYQTTLRTQGYTTTKKGPYGVKEITTVTITADDGPRGYSHTSKHHHRSYDSHRDPPGSSEITRRDVSTVREPAGMHPPKLAASNDSHTRLEGMVPLPDYQSHTQQRTYPAATAAIDTDSPMPPTSTSLLSQPRDQEMALRQTRIETLPAPERREQEKWAQHMIQLTGCCPENFAWRRIAGGYQCDGGHHLIMDELLAEGEGGIMRVLFPRDLSSANGPYYPDPSTGRYYFGVVGPRGSFGRFGGVGSSGMGIGMGRLGNSGRMGSGSMRQLGSSRRF